ncbi:type II secretion system minor pseudopilin GspK [Variovorax sp. ZS18.2.2]|uniref:type II secretion system minor pseudopilin GspK n=1 Tax=Variovorax sp. ZS18.2.2 TaxID=2971255 RepID=UPI002151409C|nr:type II secretion system minor pseudopilin GspK [Variovorax sp. ZS18.2.2]MCR6476363.1 type II secretion system minor pseudopilin GspK [Variovorax sp. ZS18.2.2]
MHAPMGIRAGQPVRAFASIHDIHARQRGMAVVSALLIVAVIAALAAGLLGRQSAFIRTTQGDQSRVQARWLLRGEIGEAQRVLRAEALRDVTTRLDGLWNQPFARQASGQVAADGGRLVSEITDEQGKFNLRNLVDAVGVDPAEVEVFTRLCATVGVPPRQAQAIMRRVILSLGDAESQAPGDVTQEVRTRAAKAAAALGLPAELPRAPTAPRPRVVEDLLAVPGMDPAMLARLAPFVTVLPQRTWINANTASAELIAAGVPGLSLDRARALLAARDRGQWFVNRGDFVNRLRMPALDLNEMRMGITSNWFRVASVLDTARTKFVQVALLHDDKTSMPRVTWLREGV